MRPSPFDAGRRGHHRGAGRAAHLGRRRPARHRADRRSRARRERRGESLRDLVKSEPGPCLPIRPAGARRTAPHVVLIVGVNGTGKTTTVGKLANLAGQRRAAAHLRRRHVPRRRGGTARDLGRARRRRHRARARGSDPAAVVFDAISSGKARDRSPILVDTAGRLHARQPDERAREDPSRGRTRGERGAARSADRARCDSRSERPDAGSRVHGRGRRERRRAHQARWHGEGRRRGRDRPRPEAAHPIRGVGEGIDDLVPFSPTSTWTPSSISRGRRPRPGPPAAGLSASPSAAAAAPAPIPWSAPWSPRRWNHRWRGLPSAGRHHMRRCTRSMRPASVPAAQALLHARAVLPHRAHGPCVERIVAAGITRGRGRRHGSEPARGWRRLRLSAGARRRGRGRRPCAQAARQNAAFFTFMRSGRPLVLLKAAVSLDGCIAAAPGTHPHLRGRGASRTQRPAPRWTRSRWIGHAARGRPAADGAGGLPRSAVHARGVRSRLRTPPAARVFARAAGGPSMSTASSMTRTGPRPRLFGPLAPIEAAEGPSIEAALRRLGRSASRRCCSRGGRPRAAAWDAV